MLEEIVGHVVKHVVMHVVKEGGKVVVEVVKSTLCDK